MRLATGIFLLVVPFLCFAQEELNDDRKILKRPDVNAAMSEPVYNRLSRIHDQMGEDQLSEALDALRKLENQALSKYEKALVQQTFGFVYAQQGNEAEAIKRFENSLATESLPAQAHQGMLYSLAGLYAAEGQYLKSIETVREWFRYETEPVADAYMLIGSSFAELERFGDALPYVLKAIEKADEPRENWYMLAVAIRFQQDQYRAAADLLVTMLQHWPDKVRYWEMLSGCYLEIEDDKRALDSMMLAYSNGMVTKPERIKALVQLSMMRDMPYTAGTILDEELAKGTIESDEANLKMLLQAWLSAREYDSAVEVINRLEKYSDDGEYFLRAAQIFNETGAWEKVIDNANKALDLGLEDPQDALMLAGIAHSELGQLTEATQVFNRVRAVGDSDDRRNADSWIAFIDEKRQLSRAKLGSN
jgi:tetratricopeptide (TPR) repeat protein